MQIYNSKWINYSTFFHHFSLILSRVDTARNTNNKCTIMSFSCVRVGRGRSKARCQQNTNCCWLGRGSNMLWQRLKVRISWKFIIFQNKYTSLPQICVSELEHGAVMAKLTRALGQGGAGAVGSKIFRLHPTCEPHYLKILYMTEKGNESMNDLLNEWKMLGGIKEWMNEWMSEWMND